MSQFTLSHRSYQKMEGIHPDLCRIVERAIVITCTDFTVLEGLRTLDRQKNLVASGASNTLRSRHLTGHAVDLGAYVDGCVDWSWPLYYKIAAAMKQAADELDIDIVWGGDWTTFPDGPHFQLSWQAYPS
ncbi:hypothetical protein CS022_22515 [Veronia nyctiphanis]|uniref:Peptidase M15C domain-containing protein n=1 Tax=Veronia nyctiphanis TaxID=1278244 RepID=A0A4Q0YJN7_9GAMM|nr:M15 family metallopeptidase [Veronia nyctiphanis]RXJ70643.1 hypothetical protein CS022_22515 [Veronia nyctiphanis]